MDVEVTDDDRPPLSDLGQCRRHQLGIVAGDPAHTAPGVLARHAPAQQRMALDRMQGCLVAPVLEHLAAAPQPPAQGVAVVRAEAGEEHQLVAAGDHVDRVELHGGQPVEHPPEMAPIHPTPGTRVGEPWAASATRRASRRLMSMAAVTGEHAIGRSPALGLRLFGSRMQLGCSCAAHDRTATPRTSQTSIGGVPMGYRWWSISTCVRATRAAWKRRPRSSRSATTTSSMCSTRRRPTSSVPGRGGRPPLPQGCDLHRRHLTHGDDRSVAGHRRGRRVPGRGAGGRGAALRGLRGQHHGRRRRGARAVRSPTLSKQVLAGHWDIDRLPLTVGVDGGIDALDLEWRLGTLATGLDLDARQVILADGERLGFDGLVIATGATPAAAGQRGPGRGPRSARWTTAWPCGPRSMPAPGASWSWARASSAPRWPRPAGPGASTSRSSRRCRSRSARRSGRRWAPSWPTSTATMASTCGSGGRWPASTAATTGGSSGSGWPTARRSRPTWWSWASA